MVLNYYKTNLNFSYTIPLFPYTLIPLYTPIPLYPYTLIPLYPYTPYPYTPIPLYLYTFKPWKKLKSPSTVSAG